MTQVLIGVKKYKVFECRYCHRYFLTQAEKTVTCPYCHSIMRVRDLIVGDYLVYSSDEWSEAMRFLQNLERRF